MLCASLRFDPENDAQAIIYILFEPCYGAMIVIISPSIYDPLPQGLSFSISTFISQHSSVACSLQVYSPYGLDTPG